MIIKLIRQNSVKKIFEGEIENVKLIIEKMREEEEINLPIEEELRENTEPIHITSKHWCIDHFPIGFLPYMS